MVRHISGVYIRLQEQDWVQVQVSNVEPVSILKMSLLPDADE